MKKLLVILSMVLVSASITAQVGGDYIKTDEGTFFFKKIKSSADNFIGIKKSGEKVKFDKENVKSYVLKGIYYQKMPVYENNVSTGEEDFMKLVETKKGMVLLEYKHLSKTNGRKAIKYFVFKNDRFVVEMDDKNQGTLTAFFDTY